MAHVSLDFILLNPVGLDYNAQLAVANQAFAPCRVQFFVGEISSVDPHLTLVLLGRRLEIERNLEYDSAANQIARHAREFLRSRIKVVFVRNIQVFRAFSVGRSLDALRGHRLGERAYVSDAARSDTLAHELSHILLDDVSENHHAASDNLMSDGPTRTGRNLDNQQRQTIYNNARGDVRR